MRLQLVTVAFVSSWAILMHGVAFAQSNEKPSSGESATTTQTLKIWTFGGLLGQIEGFCEDPGGRYDWKTSTGTYLAPCRLKEAPEAKWLGGAMGTARLLRDKPKGDLVIVTGNNQAPTPARPPTGYWDELLKANPDVVALAEEDFARSMRAPNGSAKAILTLVDTNPNIPFLVSNVAIRMTEAGLNRVEFAADGYGIHGDVDTTIGWFDAIKLHHPSGASPTANLEEFGHDKPAPTVVGQPVQLAEVKAGKDGEDGTVTFPSGLRPSRWYRLTISEAGAQKLALVFRTDAALTPRTEYAGEKNKEAFSGFPVMATEGSSVLVIPLINPDARAEARSASWEWTDRGSKSYELVFTDPVKTLEAFRKRALLEDEKPEDSPPAAEGAVKKESPPPPPPVIVLVSHLTDEQTLELLQKSPDVRFAILSPETTLLGRAAKQETIEKTRYSGDLGFSGVMDSMNSQTTRVVVRPEWFGETTFFIDATLSFAEGAWSMSVPKVKMRVTPGAALAAVADRLTVNYFADYKASDEAPVERLLLASKPHYRYCEFNAPGPCANFRRLWSTTEEITATVGDAIRRATLSDISIVPKWIVDPDYGVFVERLVKVRGTDWISQYVLERLLYTSPRMVRAYVKGDALIETLSKAVKEDEESCVSGIGATCPTTIDKDHPERFEVNGRVLNPHLVYRIALPDSLAETLKLDHDENQAAIDLVQTASDYLRDDRWDISPGVQPLGPLMERRRNRHWEGYWAIPTLDAGFTRAALPEDDDPGVRKNLGIGFRGAEEHTTLAIDVESDLAPLDYQRWAVRFPASVKFQRREEDDEKTYEKDEWSVGGRFDLKLPPFRPYIGYFIEGNWRDHPEELRATRTLGDIRDGFSGTESAKFETAYEIRPKRYRYYAVGLDAFEGLSTTQGRAIATLKRLGVRLGRGVERNVPRGITIGNTTELDGVPLLDLVLSAGEQGMLNRYFVANPDTFSATDTIQIDFQSVNQDRFQADAEGRFSWKWGTREFAVDTSLRHRWYDSDGGAFSPFLLAQEQRFQIKASVPFIWRLKLTAGYEKHRAEIEGSAIETPEPQRTRFSYELFDVKVSWPLMFRIKRGGFVR